MLTGRKHVANSGTTHKGVRVTWDNKFETIDRVTKAVGDVDDYRGEFGHGC